MNSRAAASWDAEYASGRYRHEPPVGFARDIIDAARSRNLARGLYIGCGNGRNFIPLSEAGLDLIGLDISARAVAQLRQRRPSTAGLIVGGIDALRPSAEFDLVIGIQVFQHGHRDQAHQHLTGAAARVAPGGCCASGSTPPGPTSGTGMYAPRKPATAASPPVTSTARKPGSRSTSSPRPS